MSTKLPSRGDVKFFLAEDVRPESNGKMSLMGLLPGEFVGVLGPSPPAANIAFAIPSLSFLFVVSGPSSGQFSTRFRITAPDKKTVVLDVPSEAPIRKTPGKPAAFGTAAKPFLGPAFGTYRVHLELGKAKFSFPFTIEKAPEPPKSKQKSVS